MDKLKASFIEKYPELAANDFAIMRKRLGYVEEYMANTIVPVKNQMLNNFGIVTPRIARGAQPSSAAVQMLYQMGFKTIINLRSEDDKPYHVGNMNYVHISMEAMGKPTMNDVKTFLETVSHPKSGPIFFHCLLGIDRTGTMAACYRIVWENFTVERCVSEMESYGFDSNWEAQKSKVELLHEVFAARHLIKAGLDNLGDTH